MKLLKKYCLFFLLTINLWGLITYSFPVYAHNVPEKVIEFLLDNPQATETEIQEFIAENPDLEGMMPFGYGENSRDFLLKDKKSSTPTTPFWVNAGVFIVLGINHIFSGIDHILFVISLVLVAMSWRKIATLVSTFTIAHSLTLILSGSGLLAISAKIVEPIIALSIAYTALITVFLAKYSKIFRKFKHKVWIVFLFGLFHGLGFAGALGDFDIPQEKFLSSLLFFNGGVEIGQIVILLVVLPILWFLRKTKYGQKIINIFAVIIIIISMVWFFQRIFQ